MSSTTQTSPARAGEVLWSCEPIRYLIRAVIAFLREVFGSAPDSNYFFNANDPDASRLMITSDLPVSAEVIGDRPHIVVFLGGLQFQGVGLDQLKQMSMLGGTRTHQDTITGNLTMSVLSRNAEEATYIAWMIIHWTWVLRRVLLSVGFHDIGQRMTMTPPSAPGQMVTNDLDGEIVSVSVIAPFQFVWEVGVTELGNQLLRKIEISIETSVPSDFPSMAERHSVPLGIIGSATQREDGSRITRTPDPISSVIPDIRERRRYMVVGTMDETPVVNEPIELSFTLEGEE